MVLGVAGGPTAARQAADRVALVIGNSTYGPIGDLENPRNDAADVGAALGRLGFEVTTVLDVDQVAFNQALLDFTRRSAGADMALVFYAGHGLEIDGVNYMVPVNARLERDTDVRFAAVSLDNMLAATQGARLRVVVLDACRNNPLARTIRRTSSTRSISRGSFGELDEAALGDETFVAYAAAAGTTAADGTGSRNSPYTAALLEYLEQPLELSSLFRRVRARVLETTEGVQRPHEYGSLLRDHYLSGTSGVVTPPALTALRLQQELAFWQSIAGSENPADFEAYLEQYADGQFARLADNRLAALQEAQFWAAIAESDSPADFAAYLEQHAAGRYAPLARQRFAALSAPPAPEVAAPAPVAPAPAAIAAAPAVPIERDRPAIAVASATIEPAPPVIESPVSIESPPPAIAAALASIEPTLAAIETAPAPTEPAPLVIESPVSIESPPPAIAAALASIESRRRQRLRLRPRRRRLRLRPHRRRLRLRPHRRRLRLRPPPSSPIRRWSRVWAPSQPTPCSWSPVRRSRTALTVPRWWCCRRGRSGWARQRVRSTNSPSERYGWGCSRWAGTRSPATSSVRSWPPRTTPGMDAASSTTTPVWTGRTTPPGRIPTSRRRIAIRWCA